MKEIEKAEKIWQKHAHYIRKFCTYKLSSHPDMIDDCLQEIFLALLNTLKDNSEIQYEKAWLTKVASNKINDIYEAESKKSSTIVPLEEAYIKSGSTIDENINEKDIEKHLETILSQLTENEKYLLEEFYSKNTKQADIAEELGISQLAVRQQIFRLKRKITALVHNLLY